ncbi:hypothetical protein WR25_19250 isoform D [Diploscapter pachys]|uniref:Uncharacterized protein n=1 Tax=Diploscapter pachys TaxID=2018661 RepID=A0A2A2L1A2_9BILA|nr:hypothetical protein WR25_19250 isoform D [Diploscapter pachys]
MVRKRKRVKKVNVWSSGSTSTSSESDTRPATDSEDQPDPPPATSHSDPPGGGSPRPDSPPNQSSGSSSTSSIRSESIESVPNSSGSSEAESPPGAPLTVDQLSDDALMMLHNILSSKMSQNAIKRTLFLTGTRQDRFEIDQVMQKYRQSMHSLAMCCRCGSLSCLHQKDAVFEIFDVSGQLVSLWTNHGEDIVRLHVTPTGTLLEQPGFARRMTRDSRECICLSLILSYDGVTSDKDATPQMLSTAYRQIEREISSAKRACFDFVHFSSAYSCFYCTSDATLYKTSFAENQGRERERGKDGTLADAAQRRFGFKSGEGFALGFLMPYHALLDLLHLAGEGVLKHILDEALTLTRQNCKSSHFRCNRPSFYQFLSKLHFPHSFRVPRNYNKSSGYQKELLFQTAFLPFSITGGLDSPLGRIVVLIIGVIILANYSRHFDRLKPLLRAAAALLPHAVLCCSGRFHLWKDVTNELHRREADQPGQKLLRYLKMIPSWPRTMEDRVFNCDLDARWKSQLIDGYDQIFSCYLWERQLIRGILGRRGRPDNREISRMSRRKVPAEWLTDSGSISQKASSIKKKCAETKTVNVETNAPPRAKMSKETDISKRAKISKEVPAKIVVHDKPAISIDDFLYRHESSEREEIDLTEDENLSETNPDEAENRTTGRRKKGRKKRKSPARVRGTYDPMYIARTFMYESSGEPIPFQQAKGPIQHYTEVYKPPNLDPMTNLCREFQELTTGFTHLHGARMTAMASSYFAMLSRDIERLFHIVRTLPKSGLATDARSAIKYHAIDEKILEDKHEVLIRLHKYTLECEDLASVLKSCTPTTGNILGDLIHGMTKQVLYKIYSSYPDTVLMSGSPDSKELLPIDQNFCSKLVDTIFEIVTLPKSLDEDKHLLAKADAKCMVSNQVKNYL